MSVQMVNRRKRHGSKHEYIGVDRVSSGNFRAKQSFLGQDKYLGVFPTAYEAAQAYDDTVEKLIGSRPNDTTKPLLPIPQPRPIDKALPCG